MTRFSDKVGLLSTLILISATLTYKVWRSKPFFCVQQRFQCNNCFTPLSQTLYAHTPFNKFKQLLKPCVYKLINTLQRVCHLETYEDTTKICHGLGTLRTTCI